MDVPNGCRRINSKWAVTVEPTEPQAVFHLCCNVWNELPPDVWVRPDPCLWCNETMLKQTAMLIALQLKLGYRGVDQTGAR